MKILKSIGAVVAGFLAVFILSVVTDAILETVGIFPPATEPHAFVAWMYLLALAYRSLFTLLGGYLTARLAPGNGIRLVVILAIIGGLGGVLGAIAGWDKGAHWYTILLAITGPIFVVLGGLIYIRRQNRLYGDTSHKIS